MLTAEERVAKKRVRIADLRAKIGNWWWDHKAYPHQIPPEGDWFFWLAEEGRGAGKTAGAARYVAKHLNGPRCFPPKHAGDDDVPHRVALIAPTLGDAVESAVTDADALVRLHPEAKFTTMAGGSTVKWPNGSQVRLFGTLNREDVERLRAGGDRCLVWAEELATWRQLDQAWKDMMLGLRIGPNPRIVATTTPKPRPEYVKIRLQADHITNAETDDNPNLNPAHRRRLYKLYDGTSIAEQELKGKLLEEADGAIWTMELITTAQNYDLLKPVEPEADEDEPHVVDGHDVGHLSRVVVAVDPPGGATEAGIIIAGTLSDCPCKGPKLPHFAVLEDRSGKLSPVRWGGRAVASHKKWSSDRVVAESNFGGDMVESTIRHIDIDVPYKYVRATRGKQVRAEPIMALYEQGRVHHVREFGALEGEMVTWIPGESEWSPNRLDALVWALTELSKRKEFTWG